MTATRRHGWRAALRVALLVGALVLGLIGPLPAAQAATPHGSHGHSHHVAAVAAAASSPVERHHVVATVLPSGSGSLAAPAYPSVAQSAAGESSHYFVTVSVRGPPAGASL